MIDDERLAALARDMEAASRQVEALLTPALRQQLAQMQRVFDSDFARKAHRASDLARTAQRAIDQAGAWRNRMRDARQQPPSAQATRRVDALQAKAPAVVDDLQAAQVKIAALQAARRLGQRRTTARKQDDAANFAKRVDDRLAKSDAISLDEAIEAELKNAGARRRSKDSKQIVVADWSELAPEERNAARYAAKRRYAFGKKILATR